MSGWTTGLILALAIGGTAAVSAGTYFVADRVCARIRRRLRERFERQMDARDPDWRRNHPEVLRMLDAADD